MIPVVTIKHYRRVPTEDEILAKMLEALRHHGNLATNAEVRTYVVAALKITELVQNYNYTVKDDLDPILSRGKTKYKKMGLVDNPRRGTWKLTKKGLVKATRKPPSTKVQISKSVGSPTEVFFGDIIDEDIAVNPDKAREQIKMLKEANQGCSLHPLNPARGASAWNIRFGIEGWS